MDSPALCERLRRLAAEVDANKEVIGTGAAGLSDGPFLREVADALDDLDSGKLTEPKTLGPVVAAAVARKVSVA